MTFDRKITLISSEQKNGSQGKADRAVKTVYAKVSEPGVTAKKPTFICYITSAIKI